MDEDDVLQAIPGHVTPLDARIGEAAGESLAGGALDAAGAIPPLLRIIEKIFQPAACTDRIGYPIAIHIHKLNFRVL